MNNDRIIENPASHFIQFHAVFVSLAKDLEVEKVGDHASEENTLDETGAGTYLSLKEMGAFLSCLARYGDGTYPIFMLYKFYYNMKERDTLRFSQAFEI